MRSILVCLLILGSARVAVAQAQDEKTERARIHLKAAIAYYDEARYEDAAREMEAAYRAQAAARSAVQPGAVLRAARPLRRRGDGVRDLPEGERRRRPIASSSRRASSNLRERAAATAAGSQAAPLPASGEKVVFKTIVVYKQAPPPPGRGVRIAAYGLGVLALGALGSGIAFAVLAKQDADAVTKGGSTTIRRRSTARARDAEERADRRHRLGRELRRGGAVRGRRCRAVPPRQQDRQGGAEADHGAVAVADGRRLRARGTLLMRAAAALAALSRARLLQPVAAGGRVSLLDGGQLVSVGAALHLRAVREVGRSGGLLVHADGVAAGERHRR